MRIELEELMAVIHKGMIEQEKSVGSMKKLTWHNLWHALNDLHIKKTFEAHAKGKEPK